MADKTINSMKIDFSAKSVNEAFARTAVAAFASQLDPSIAVIADIKTVVSEAVTNAIVHAYAGCDDREVCRVYINCKLSEGGKLTVKIKDKGRGIEDIEAAMQPLYTTDAEGERSGMGFTIMQSFTDRIKVTSKPNKGTSVTLEKRLIEK